MTAKLCSKPGCRELGKHSHDDRRPSASRRGYDGSWRKRRLLHLALEPLCRKHYRRGELVEATEVDHIIPLSQGGADKPENYQSLCHWCHSEKTFAQMQFSSRAR